MKKQHVIVSLVLATFLLSAFGYRNWNEPEPVPAPNTPSLADNFVFDNYFDRILYKPIEIDLLYKIDSRFIHTLTKEKLDKATTIIDILPEKATQSIESYRNVRVAVLKGKSETTEKGDNEILNPAQRYLLQTAGYSANIYISAEYNSNNVLGCRSADDQLVYYMTITPEKEAAYTGGYDALIEYLRENSKEQTLVIHPDGLKPGTVTFTVTKEGTVSNVRLTSTSGYPTVDEVLVELIGKMPGKWDPATNALGEKVDQELVFFFGMEGC